MATLSGAEISALLDDAVDAGRIDLEELADAAGVLVFLDGPASI